MYAYCLVRKIRDSFYSPWFCTWLCRIKRRSCFMYKVDNKYTPQAEASIIYNDETLGIDWPLAESQMLLSSKDKEGTAFKDAVYFE